MKKLNTEITVAIAVANEAKSLLVQNPNQAKYATEILSRANQALDFLTTKRAERTKRLREELEFIDTPYVEPQKILKAIIADLRQKLGSYQTSAAQLAAGKAQVVANQAEKGSISTELAVKRLDDIVLPAGKIVASTGSLSFRPTPKLKITSVKKIPRKYLVPDEATLLAALKEGTKIAGCRIEIIQVPINRRA